jgi:16S rRNA (cytidine1402-2'-O)-methyltransferase
MTVNSSTQNQTGLLIMASNSLGNVLDIPKRSLEAAASSDLVVFEEDKIARQVLKAAGVHREYLKFNEHRQKDTLEEIRDALNAGKTVTYMSDQGSPVLEDPGADILAVAYQTKARVTVIPGPCSVSAAISATPFATHGYVFVGFLPREEADRVKKLKDLSKLQSPFVIMDTPYRLKALLSSCSEVLGKGRKAMLALDISGESENFALGTFDQLRQVAEKLTEKLNFVLVVSAN